MATQDLTGKKRAYMFRLKQAFEDLNALRLRLQGLASEWNANGYSTGIVQGDIQDPELLHLTPAILGNAMNAQIQLENYFTNAAVTTGNWQTNVNAVVGK